MADRLMDIKGRLRSLESKLDEQAFQSLRSGIDLLEDSMSSTNTKSKNDQLVLALDRFSNLVSLDPTGVCSGTLGNIGNRYLQCAGYWGKYHYFVLTEDYNMALKQVYECAFLHPTIALAIFEPELFDTPGSNNSIEQLVDRHKKLLSKRRGLQNPEANLQELRKQVEDCQTELSDHIAKDGRSQVGSVVAAVAGGLTGFLFTPAVGITLGGGAYRVLRQSYTDQTTEITARLENLRSERDLLSVYQTEEKSLSVQIRDICNQRLSEITKMTPQGIRQLMMTLGNAQISRS